MNNIKTSNILNIGFFIFLTPYLCLSQDSPFKKFGHNEKMLTLSKGKYIEVFDRDSIEIVGSALLNTNTMKVVGFVEKDTFYSECELEPDVMSRWLSPDPLAYLYPSLTPYNFVANNPIVFTDPDGRKIRPTNSNAKKVLETGFDNVFESFPEVRKHIVYKKFTEGRNGQPQINAFLYVEKGEEKDSPSLRLSRAKKIISSSKTATRDEKLTALAYLEALNEKEIYEVQTPYKESTEDNYSVLTRSKGLSDYVNEIRDNKSQGASTEELIRGASGSNEGEASFRGFPDSDGTIITTISNGDIPVWGIYNFLPSSDENQTQQQLNNIIFKITEGYTYTEKKQIGKNKMERTVHRVSENGKFSSSEPEIKKIK